MGEEDDPLSLHLYTYCYNNPVSYLDRGGNFPIEDFFNSAYNWFTNSKANDKESSHVMPNPTTMPKPIGPRPKPKKKGFKITQKQLKKLGWVKSSTKIKSVKKLNKALEKYKMDKVQIARHFISQCMHESALGEIVSEQWEGDDKYEYFRKYERGNLGKQLGNTKKDDGYRFRGVGYIQVTGRHNQSKFAKAVGDKKIESEGTDYIKKKGSKYLWLISAFWWDMS